MPPGRRVAPLTRDRLLLLGPAPWGEPWPAPGPLAAPDLTLGTGDQPTELAPWAARTLTEWGHCGMLADGPEAPLGVLLVVPAALAPRVGALATAPFGTDAAVLASAVVDPARRRQGVGRHLVQAAAADLVSRGTVALEAVGHRVGAVEQGGLPEGWLTAVGFRLVRDHPLAPRYRMDLTSTVRWKPDLAAAWQRIRSLVAQPIPPEPARFEAEPPAPPARDHVVPRTTDGSSPAPSR